VASSAFCASGRYAIFRVQVCDGTITSYVGIWWIGSLPLIGSRLTRALRTNENIPFGACPFAAGREPQQ
jgi:hypothetical protein